MRAVFLGLSSGVICALLFVGCGGSGSPAESPERPSGATEGTDLEEDATATERAREQPQRCTDGTCFECGDGICPEGYYCDETGEPACSWLPACAAEPSCSCLKDRLGSDCSCDERDGGLFVSCK